MVAQAISRLDKSVKLGSVTAPRLPKVPLVQVSLQAAQHPGSEWH